MWVNIVQQMARRASQSTICTRQNIGEKLECHGKSFDKQQQQQTRTEVMYVVYKRYLNL